MTDSEPTIRATDAKRRATVLQVLPGLVSGGVERGTVDMAQALVAAGWNSLVASAGGPMVREIERAGATHITLPLASKNPLVMRANVRRLAEIIRQHGVDIVHARSRAPAWSARSAAKRAGAHFVTTFHNAYRGKSWLKRRYNAIMAEGERVIAISRFVAERAAAAYGVPWDRIRIVHRGVDVKRFDPEKVAAERIVRLAGEWRLPDGVPIVMLPARVSRWKGHTVLIEAMRLLNRPQVHVLLVGGGGSPRYQASLAQAIRRAGSAVTFRMLGECRDMPAAYMLADIVVSASTEPEGFGRVTVEAQSMGRPKSVGRWRCARSPMCVPISPSRRWRRAPSPSMRNCSAPRRTGPRPRERRSIRASAHPRHQARRARRFRAGDGSRRGHSTSPRRCAYHAADVAGLCGARSPGALFR